MTFIHHKKVIQIIVLMLALSLLLAGCAGRSGKTPPSSAPSAQSQEGDAPGDNADETPIVFKDPMFEKLIKAELGKETIMPSDLSGFTGIQIAADQFVFLSGPDRPDKSIVLFHPDEFEYEDQRYTGYGTMKTLEDLKYFPKLTALRVALQPEIDYNTIPISSQLTIVSISLCTVNSIDFLADAENLKYLHFSGNDISDISVVKNCVNLKSLSVDYNNVSDLSPIANLTSLTKVEFYENQITDITPLGKLTALEEIGMYNNSISDISVLAGLPNLTYVEFIGNQISDVSPLKDFKSFERLALTGNPVENIEVVSHIENLEF